MLPEFWITLLVIVGILISLGWIVIQRVIARRRDARAAEDSHSNIYPMF